MALCNRARGQCSTDPNNSKSDTREYIHKTRSIQWPSSRELGMFWRLSFYFFFVFSFTFHMFARPIDYRLPNRAVSVVGDRKNATRSVQRALVNRFGEYKWRGIVLGNGMRQVLAEIWSWPRKTRGIENAAARMNCTILCIANVRNNLKCQFWHARECDNVVIYYNAFSYSCYLRNANHKWETRVAYPQQGHRRHKSFGHFHIWRTRLCSHNEFSISTSNNHRGTRVPLGPSFKELLSSRDRDRHASRALIRMIRSRLRSPPFPPSTSS